MSFYWYEKGEWKLEEKAKPLEEFLAMYIWRAIILKGTMGFCLAMDKLAKVIYNGIQEYRIYNQGKKWTTRFD